jgi:hypothetical protein
MLSVFLSRSITRANIRSPPASGAGFLFPGMASRVPPAELLDQPIEGFHNDQTAFAYADALQIRQEPRIERRAFHAKVMRSVDNGDQRWADSAAKPARVMVVSPPLGSIGRTFLFSLNHGPPVFWRKGGHSATA